jgi:hypothetical protein
MKHWKNHAKSKKKKRVLKRNDFIDILHSILLIEIIFSLNENKTFTI